MKKVYFPGLNGVRCIAAFLVIFCHIELFKFKTHLPSLAGIGIFKNFINNIGHHGVLIFFALSGFLITYLLLKERDETNDIAIRKFYVRRILRIWPLYFLIVIAGFFILPHTFSPDYFSTKVVPDFGWKLFLTVFFLPNFVFIYFGSIFCINVLWSIGTEEQFYLIWPHLTKRISGKNGLFFMLAAILTVLVMKILLMKLAYYLGTSSAKDIVLAISKMLEYDAMLIGGLAALLLYKWKSCIGFLFHRGVQLVALILGVFLVLKFPDLGHFTNIVFCPIYALLILNIAGNEGSLIKLNNKVLDFLGGISFGMYLFHSLCIALVIELLKNYQESLSTFSYNALLYVLAVGGTVLISSASYYMIERPILKFKSNFMVIKSGKLQ